MHTKNTIILEIFKDIPFSEDESIHIESKLEKLTIKKGDILLNAGKSVNHQYFVSDGCLRTCYTDNSGKEHTIQFAIKNWWISDYTAFFSTTKAVMSIECIQDAVIYKISREDMDALCVEIPQLETFFRKKMEGAFANFQKRILGGLSQSAKERYASFINTYPNIEQSVKNYHIASYLGVTTETLSRIRKELTKD